ncbi:MAG: HlyC/CorC family transporter [Bryobacterales bacterium]|nr:HlyC/CorC family transporter [Bryobacterales bacterium]
MELGTGYQITLVIIMLAVNAFFAAAEAALISVRPSRLRELADRGDLGAQAALSLLTNVERMLSVGQVGLTLTSLILGWLGEVVLVDRLTGGMESALPMASKFLLRGLAFAIAFLAMTFLHVVIGEVVPKNLAIEKADRMSVLVSPPLLVFYKVSLPLVYVIERTSAILSRWLGVKESKSPGAHSVEELKFMVASSHSTGHISAFQEQTIQRVADLKAYTASSVMVSRGALVTVPNDIKVDQLATVFNDTHFSRLPVYDGKPEDLIGIVHVKDVFDYLVQFRRAAIRERPLKPFDLEKQVRKVPVVPETKDLGGLLETLREDRSHVAFVVDEFGTISGMISMEDIMEHMFGEIEDEYDVHASSRALSGGDVEVEGTINLVDLEVQYGITLPGESGVETLAGFLMQELQKVPEVGDVIRHEGRLYTVLSMTLNRVDTVRISRVPGEQPAAKPVQ